MKKRWICLFVENDVGVKEKWGFSKLVNGVII